MKRKRNLFKIVLIVFIGYMGILIVNQQIRLYSIKKEIATKQIELGNAQNKRERLQDEIDSSKTDGYMEKMARERLGVIRKGETPVIHSTANK
jgi:cell division protein FtsB